MSSIYIPNIDLPKDEPGAFEVIVMYVSADKKIRAECHGTHEVTVVPDHGDLVSRDWLKKQGYFFPCATGSEYAIPLRALLEAPTIISADLSLPKLPVEHGSVGASTKEEAIKALGFDPDDFKKEINHDRI